MISVPGAKWSRSLKSWHIPDTAKNRAKCKLPVTNMHSLTAEVGVEMSKAALVCISANNKAQMLQYLQHLHLKAYSQGTIKTYRNEFAQLLQLLGNIDAQDLQPKHIQRYLLYCLQKGVKENTIHSRINALKFCYEQVLQKKRMFFNIPRPKKPLLLPEVLSKEEIASIINSVTNLKQKTMLMLAYACGLRVSEVVSLQITDINSKRMLIHLHAAKGKKDRIAGLSPTYL